MMVYVVRSVSRLSLKRSLSLLLILLQLITVAAIPTKTRVTNPAQAKVHPWLLQAASSDPTKLVRIIVQKESKTSDVEADIHRLGGELITDLPIINGFSAQIAVKDVLTLAQSEHVRWISYDAPLQAAQCGSCINAANLQNAYVNAIRASQVWNEAPYLQGQGVGVAVIDSGIASSATDLKGRVLVGVQVNAKQFSTTSSSGTSYSSSVGIKGSTTDAYGHGSHVAGVIAGNGAASNGAYIGVAPKVNLVNVQITDSTGKASSGNAIYGMQWVLDNKNAYNIRVVNLSLNSAVEESYLTSPLSAAVEILWLNGIVVVTSAGNNGTATLYPPANDPYVITVGAVDDRGTTELSDDVIPAFSAYGSTPEGYAKPDLVAPGRNIVSVYANNSQFGTLRPVNRVGQNYFRMTGTSAAAPMVTAAVALLLQDEPNLTPNQVKYRLTATANKNWPGYNASKAGAGYLDIYAAVKGTTSEASNQTLIPNQTLGKMALIALWASMNGGSTINWDTVNWGSVNWNSVNWNGVNWNSVNWNSVNWNSVNWNSVNWNSVNWNSVNWNSVNWNSVNWNSVNWNSVNWNSVNWNSDYWEENVGSASVDDETTLTPVSEQESDESAAMRRVFLPLVTK